MGGNRVRIKEIEVKKEKTDKRIRQWKGKEIFISNYYCTLCKYKTIQKRLIFEHISRVHIGKPKRREWEQEDDEFLKKHGATMLTTDLCKKFNRSKAAIQFRLYNKLGIIKDKKATFLALSIAKKGVPKPEGFGKRDSERLKKYYKLHPEKHLNRIITRPTKPEKKFNSLLQTLGFIENKHYEYNYTVHTKTSLRFPDFCFEDRKIIFEVDGVYWHKDKIKESIRDFELKEQGYKIYHFTDIEILKNEMEVKNKVEKILCV